MTADSLSYPDELFDFYQANQMPRVCFNVEEIEGPHRSSSLEGGDVRGRFSRFLSRFFDLATARGSPIRVREFDSTLAAILHGGDPEGPRTHEAVPLAIVALIFLWQPLHLTEASVWVTLGGLILFVVGAIAAIGSTIFQNWEEAFFIGVVAISTAGFYMKTTWGFWLSLLAGIGVMLLGAGTCDLFLWAARQVRKMSPQGQGQAR